MKSFLSELRQSVTSFCDVSWSITNKQLYNNFLKNPRKVSNKSPWCILFYEIQHGWGVQTWRYCIENHSINLSKRGRIKQQWHCATPCKIWIVHATRMELFMNLNSYFQNTFRYKNWKMSSCSTIFLHFEFYEASEGGPWIKCLLFER